MAAVNAAAARRQRDELVWRVGRAGDASEIFAAASSRLRQLVPFDAAAWVGTDPATGLPTAPTRVDDLDVTPAECSEYWRREYLVDDFNRFGDLARDGRPAAALRASTGDPERSSRYRRLARFLGFADELRAVFRAGDAPWGALTLWRSDGQPAFNKRETDLVASLSAPIGEALRLSARPPDDVLVRDDPPGLLTFDLAGELISANEPARSWLAELPPERGLPTDLGVDVPVWLVVTVFHAAGVMHGSGDGTARARVRLPSGQWLVCYASCLRDPDGSFASTVVVIEPAKPAEIAPIIVAAYDLSDREREITRLVARGLGTADIADELTCPPTRSVITSSRSSTRSRCRAAASSSPSCSPITTNPPTSGANTFSRSAETRSSSGELPAIGGRIGDIDRATVGR
jgi:hypothetical protein